jgi:hypothetical protein
LCWGPNPVLVFYYSICKWFFGGISMSFNLAMVLAKSVGGVGVLGGIVGGSAALAKNIKKKKEGTITNREMAIDTGKETVGAGVATAFSAFAAGTVGGGLVLSLGTAFAAAAAGKYAWDYGVEMVESRIELANAKELSLEDDSVEEASEEVALLPADKE